MPPIALGTANLMGEELRDLPCPSFVALNSRKLRHVDFVLAMLCRMFETQPQP